jgi:hypothetical protein
VIPTRILADPFLPSASAGLEQVKVYAGWYDSVAGELLSRGAGSGLGSWALRHQALDPLRVAQRQLDQDLAAK